MVLTDVKVRNAKPAEKPYRLADSDGLFLWVTPPGRKIWRYRHQVAGRERIHSLGRYPTLSLLDARRARDKIKSGADAPAAPETFEKVARAWHAISAPRWKPHHAADVMQSLEAEIFPSLGKVPINDIPAKLVLQALRPMQERGAIDTAHRVRQRINAVFDYAIAAGLASANPAAGVKPAMVPMLPGGRRPAVLTIDQARAALGSAEAVPAHPSIRLGIRLLALTAVRPGELRGARWTEFEDLAGAEPTWRIPAERMKGKKEHLVPLSRQAVETLAALATLTGRCPYAFPSAWSAHKPMSENAMGDLLHRAGLKGIQVAHGWRATFSTVMNERSPVDRGVIDLMLAHAPKDAVEAAYNRAAHLVRRRALAQEWADILLEAMSAATDLLNLPRRAREGKAAGS